LLLSTSLHSAALLEEGNIKTGTVAKVTPDKQRRPVYIYKPPAPRDEFLGQRATRLPRIEVPATETGISGSRHQEFGNLTSQKLTLVRLMVK
jgi:hypothetical protein